MIEINKEEIISVLKKNPDIRFAYLFGSQAKNKTRFGSDLDIAIYFDPEPRLLEIGKLVNELESVTDDRVDLASLNDLYKKNPKLAYSVIADGILFFCKDDKLLTLYKKNVFLYYLDFKPFIDLFDRKLNERILNKKFAVTENEK